MDQARATNKFLIGVFRNPRIDKRNAVRSYKKMVKSIGTYITEMWEINKSRKSRKRKWTNKANIGEKLERGYY